MKKSWFIIILVLLCISATAQSDSLVLVEARWKIDTIHGLILTTIHFNNQEYFHSNQNISILEIPKDSDYQLQYAYAVRRTKTSAMAQKHNALAAINGSFFDMDKHNPICYLRINGEEVGINTPGKDTINRKYYQYGTMALADCASDNGPLAHILHTDSARLWERTLNYTNIMTAGPLLIFQGEVQPMRNDLSFVNSRHNRTAIGILPNGNILMITVDGRTKNAAGMTLDELIQTLQWLGCTEALNMDGGGSTTMYVKDLPYSGIVNYPSDNGKFDHAGERAVSNIIMILKKH